MAALSTAIEILTSMWFEISFTLFFALGYVVMRFEKYYSKNYAPKLRNKLASRQHQFQKTIEANVASGNGLLALKTWRAAKAKEPTSVDCLKMIVQVLLDEEPSVLVQELTEHIALHPESLANSRACTAVLEIVAKTANSRNIALMEDLAKTFESDLRIFPTGPTYDALLSGYAQIGDVDKLQKVRDDMQQAGYRLTLRSHSLMIKGFLKNNQVDAAFHQIREMQNNGLSVPSVALGHLFRGAGISGDMLSLFRKAYLEGGRRLPLSSDVVGVVMEECFKRNDLEMALCVEEVARGAETPLLYNGYDPLLKLCVSHADSRALTLFARMQSDGMHITDNFCVALLVRCAEAKFLCFAENIVEFVRNRSKMSLIMYSALMKVYAFSGLFGKACDLYSQMREEGLEPDTVMYGCLMKFSVECGRTSLSQELFDKSPSLDIQNYMSLMRAASRDRDVDRAFKIFETLKGAGIQADKAAYNCVLDACVSAGEMDRARKFLEQMKQACSIDVIAYNTLLKGYRGTGDLQGAKAVFEEMGNVGIEPNDVSYNCLIHVAVNKGAFQEAWELVDGMEAHGIQVDRYTISIIMKSLKKFSNAKDVSRGVSLLDRTGIDVYSDEVLLNSVLETCTRHCVLDRLSSIIEGLADATINPSVHTCANIIKACGKLERLDVCWKFWNDMTVVRHLNPNDIVLGCMLDALVCNQRIEDAMSLFRKWKAETCLNTVIYSILIKGLASCRKATEALELWDEMRGTGLQVNTATYNAIIDSQARVGEIDKVAQLFEQMEKDGCTPDAITHSTRVKAFCNQGQIDTAYDVLRCMQANSIVKDCVVYNTLLDGCAQHRRVDVADAVLRDMQAYNIWPSSYTLGILVKMYGRCSQLNKAFEIVQEYAKKYRVVANDKVNISLIQACMQGQAPDRALVVFRSLQPTSDKRLITSMINGLVRHGRLDDAAQLVEEVCHRVGSSSITRQNKVDMTGLLGSEVVEGLFFALAKRERTQRMIAPLMEKMRAVDVPVNSKMLHYAVEKPCQQRPWNANKGA